MAKCLSFCTGTDPILPVFLWQKYGLKSIILYYAPAFPKARSIFAIVLRPAECFPVSMRLMVSWRDAAS